MSFETSTSRQTAKAAEKGTPGSHCFVGPNPKAGSDTNNEVAEVLEYKPCVVNPLVLFNNLIVGYRAGDGPEIVMLAFV